MRQGVHGRRNNKVGKDKHLCVISFPLYRREEEANFHELCDQNKQALVEGRGASQNQIVDLLTCSIVTIVTILTIPLTACRDPENSLRITRTQFITSMKVFPETSTRCYLSSGNKVQVVCVRRLEGG